MKQSGFQAVVIAIVLAAFGPCAEATHGDATSRNGAIMTDDHTVQICSCGSTMPNGADYTLPNGATAQMEYIGNADTVYPRTFTGSDSSFQISTGVEDEWLFTMSYTTRVKFDECSSGKEFIFSRSDKGHAAAMQDCRFGHGLLGLSEYLFTPEPLEKGVWHDIVVVMNHPVDGKDTDGDGEIDTFLKILVNGTLVVDEHVAANVPKATYGDWLFSPKDSGASLQTTTHDPPKIIFDGVTYDVEWAHGADEEIKSPTGGKSISVDDFMFGVTDLFTYVVILSDGSGFQNVKQEAAEAKFLRIGAAVNSEYSVVSQFQGSLQYLIMYNYALPDAVSAQICTQCPNGMFQSESNQLTCSPCSVGQYSPVGSCTCASCVKGKQDHDRRPNSTCEDCAVGTYCDGGAILPVQCPSGTVDADLDPATTCHFCGWAGDNSMAGSVTHSSGGDYCPGGDDGTVRTLCGPGTYDHDNLATTPCSACPANAYCPGGNKQSKKMCTKDSTSPASSSAVTDCTCSPGVYGAITTVASRCTACAENTFKALPGPKNCDSCPQYSVNQRTGSITGADCHCRTGYGGTDAVVDSNGAVTAPASCSTCSGYMKGTYKDVVAGEPCKTCVAGKTTNQCSFGDDNLLCDDIADCVCTIGFGTASCAACPGGHYKSALGPIDCKQCSKGKYMAPDADPTDSKSCISCILSTFDHDADPTTECIQCESQNIAFSTGSYCAGGAANRVPCDNTKPYYMFDHDNNTATPCERNGPSQASIDLGDGAVLDLGGCTQEFFDTPPSEYSALTKAGSPCGEVTFSSDAAATTKDGTA